MFGIHDSVLLSLNSIVVLIFIVTIFIVLVKVATMKDNLKMKGVFDKNLEEILDCIKNHENTEKKEKLKQLSQNNKNLINSPFGSLKNTPFLYACENGASIIVQEMLKMGGDIKYTNIEGNGPMYLAVYYLCKNRSVRDANLIRTLYYCGCDINVKNNKGYTPLHLAAYFGHIPLIHWLINKGADVNIPPLSSGLALANGQNMAAYILYVNQNRNDKVIPFKI